MPCVLVQAEERLPKAGIAAVIPKDRDHGIFRAAFERYDLDSSNTINRSETRALNEAPIDLADVHLIIDRFT